MLSKLFSYTIAIIAAIVVISIFRVNRETRFYRDVQAMKVLSVASMFFACVLAQILIFGTHATATGNLIAIVFHTFIRDVKFQNIANRLGF
jgi:multisubunit Na+/H+ antiporter MnhG subunit